MGIFEQNRNVCNACVDNIRLAPDEDPDGLACAERAASFMSQLATAFAADRVATGKQLNLKVVVDPSVLGGIVATVGDTVIDGSVRTRIDQLKSRL
jgi:hypothetical protein